MIIEIHFGAMVPRLKAQLKGYKIRRENLYHHQCDADALVRLHMRGILSDSEVKRGRDKLMKKIVASVYL